MKHGLGLSLAIMLTGVACLVAPNPDFIDSDGTDETGSGECPVGTLDCDDQPGCETDATDPATCGSCEKRCELAGEMLECVAGQCAGSIVFVDLPDAYVDHGQPDQNFGAEPLLLIDGARESYIELPNIGALPSGATVESVALHLTCTVPGASLDVYRVETPWDESAITGSNAPGNNNTRLLTVASTLGGNVIELVGLLPSWRTGNPKRSLELRVESNGSEPAPVEFSSREGASPPSLVLTLRW